MLKKSDLAKQFELVVKQEIKNYQDSHNFILQSIRDLKENIHVVEYFAKEAFAKLECRQSKMFSEINELSNELKSLERRCDSRFNDLERFRGDSGKESTLQKHLLKKNEEEILKIDAKIDEVFEMIEELKNDCKTQSLSISNNFDFIQNKLSKDLIRMKDDILSIPSEAEKIRVEYDDKIDCHKIDVEGILKEIRISRKDMIVIQKQIENIYTLISRLKKQEVSE